MSPVSDLQTAHLCLRAAHFHGKRAHPQPTLNDARDLLAELGTPTRVLVETELARLGPGAVISDAKGFVCERWRDSWRTVGASGEVTPVLPAEVLREGEES